MSLISGGQLRHRVTVLTPSTSVDSYGERSTALTTGPTIYAEVRSTGASEISYGDGAAMRTAYEIRTRWRTGINAGITATSVLEYRGDQLQVQGFVREREEEDVMLIDAVRVA
jgi:head-tail adaptor